MTERLDDVASGFEDFYDDEVDTVENSCDYEGHSWVHDATASIHRLSHDEEFICQDCDAAGVRCLNCNGHPRL